MSEFLHAFGMGYCSGGSRGGSKGSKDPPPSARPAMNKLTYEYLIT